MTRSISWLVPLLWSAACASSTTVVHTPSRGAAGPCDDLPEKALRRGIEENGPSFNGTSLDASAFGQITQAVSEPGVAASRPGTALRVARLCKGVALRDHTVRYDVVVAGTRLTAASPLAVDFAGALLLGSDTEGKVVQLRIDQIAPASGALSEVALYTLSYQRGTVTTDGAFVPSGGASWSLVCPPGKAALAVAGRRSLSRRTSTKRCASAGGLDEVRSASSIRARRPPSKTRSRPCG